MTGPVRILYAVNALETDAPTQLTAAIAIAAKRKGWQVDFVAWTRGGPIEPYLRDRGIPARALGGGMLSAAASLHRLMDQFRPHIIHTALARPSLGYALAKAMPAKTHTIWIAADHGVHEWQEKGRAIGLIMRAIMPAVMTQATAVTTVSHDAARQLRSRGVPPQSLHVIPNGVDVRRFYPALRRDRNHLLHTHFPDAPQDSITHLIGSAGNLRYIKGHDILVRAIPLVLERFPGARFIIWGDGPERPALTALAASLDVSQALAMPGHDTHLDTHLPLLDIYIQPSRVESFGLGAAEAMACGLPVIASSTGGLPELITHGTTGRLFEPDSPAALATEIKHLLTNPTHREALGDAARLHILQHFSQQGMTSAMLALYEQLLQKREAPHERN